MSITTSVDHWLSVVRKEYLQDFISSGGAAVKFLVPSERLEHQELVGIVKEASEEDGYLFVSVDASTTKVHMIDKIFHAVSRQVPWDDLAYAFLRSSLVADNNSVPEDRNDFSLEQLASLNNLPQSEMKRVVNLILTRSLLKDYSMAQEFRIAMKRLCEAHLDGRSPGASLPDSVKEWLCGELRLISALKSALIFQKITRHNGRYMLNSLTHWLHLAGKAGLVLTLDISRFLEPTRLPDGSIYYSRPAVMDGYEVLRQFIDSTDDLKFCLIIVLAPSSFLDPYERRGLHIAYEALKMRIWDEVRDRERPNPLSSLVRLSGRGDPQALQAPGGVT